MRKILFLIFFLIEVSVLAKDFPMLHYTMEDGLPSNTIYDIYQDPDGMIWIGTDKGVSRFNGIKFENFTTADGLSDNECFFFQHDYEGRLWIGTYNGKLCFYKDGVFHNEKNTAWMRLPFKASNTKFIILNKDSSLTIFFEDIPSIVNLKNNKISIYNSNYIQTKNTTYFRFHFAEKIQDGIYNITYPDEDVLINFNNNTKKITTYNGFRKSVFRDRDSQVNYYLVEEKLFNDRNQNIKYPEKNILGQLKIFNIIFRNNFLFISSSKGLWINNESVLLENTAINKTFINKLGDIWIGTATEGLYQSSTSIFKSFKYARSNNEKIVYASKNRDNLLISSAQRSLYSIKINGEKERKLFGLKHSNSNELPGVQWKNGDDFYSFSFFENYRIRNFTSPNYQVNRLKVGNMWGANLVLQNQHYIYFRNRRVIYLSSLIDFYDGNDSSKILSIAADSNHSTIYAFNKNEKNEIWISTVSNVYKIIDTIAVRQKQFNNLAFREFIFLNKTLVGITHQNQLVICPNYENEKIKFDSLANNNCVWDKLYPINDSTTLIKTNNFFRVLKIFNSDGKLKYSSRVIENPQIPFQPDYIFSDSTTIFFFKNQDIISFPLGYVLSKKTLPTIRFTTLKTDKSEENIADNINIAYEQSKNLKIRFTPISFYYQNLSYEYNISEKGKPGQWTSFTGEELNLIKIGYGNFTIQIRAKTLSGDYSKAASFRLQIQKPYWATWWFICLLFVVMVLIITIIARLGIKRRLLKKEGEVRFLRSEYKALNALMNPHFIFNSLNSVQSLINNNENTTASKYIRIFSDLIRQNMRNISNELIPLSKELDLVENYLKIEKLRFKEHLNYSIDIEEEVESEMIMIPPLLIQPLVENAIKHGIWPKKSNDGFIQIRIWESENLLKIEIEDNGNGFDNTAKTDTMHESYAMSNIQQRIEQLSQIHSSQITIQIEEKKDDKGNVKGVISIVTIQMPD